MTPHDLAPAADPAAAPGPVRERGDGPPPKALQEFGRIDLYLACHRELAPELAERLSRGLEEMRRNGELADFGLR